MAFRGHIVPVPTRGAELQRTLERLNSNDAQVRRLGARSLELAGAKKHSHYAPMLAVARKQKTDGRRLRVPRFVPMIVSTHMEFGKGVQFVQEWLCERYRNKLTAAGERSDGERIPDLVASFRSRFRFKLIMAIAKGLATRLLDTGLPGSCTRAAAAWAHDHAPPYEDVDTNICNDSAVSAVEMCNGFPVVSSI